MNNQYFETSDYSIGASLLVSPEVKLLDVASNGHGGYKLFLSPLNLCQKLANDYELNRLVVPAKQIADNIRAIKNFIKVKTEGGTQI